MILAVKRRLARVQQLLAGAEEALTYSGEAVAALYVGGARGNVRLALDMGSKCKGSLSRTRELPALGCRLITARAGSRIGRREAVGGLPHVRSPRLAGGPNLGSDLCRDGLLRRKVKDSVFAALLADALSQHRWLHLGSGALWNGGHLSARTIIQFLHGRPLPMLGPWETDGVVDAEVAACLHRTGWVWLEAPSFD